MERELLLTGIGGQGIQLAAQVITRAALAEGRSVQLFGSYGGMMRGGNTEATVVIADGPIEAPPTVGQTWSAILLHHEYAQATINRLHDGSVVLVNTSVITDFACPSGCDPLLVIDVPATDIAAHTGHPVAASMVMAGAYAAVTDLVGLDALIAAVTVALPAYRRHHIDLNVAALRAGFGVAPRAVAPAWPAAGVMGAR